MPKTRRRYYRKVKKHWASHIDVLSTETTTGTPSAPGYLVHEICGNASDNVTPIPYLIKVGNISMDLGLHFYTEDPIGEATSNWYTVGVVYVPEGVSLNSGVQVNALLLNHPEYVMWLKTLVPRYIPGAATGNGSSLMLENPSPIKVSSRLKRNLNSGDKIVFFVVAHTEQVSQEIHCEIKGFIRYFTRMAS